MNIPVDASLYPVLGSLIETQLRSWPEHEKFLTARFAEGPHVFAERIAELVSRAADDLEVFAADYHWLCDRMGEEELFFRRHGRYRLTNFEEANREVYSNADFMRRYMNGVLLSHVWWGNHARVIQHYAEKFLPGNREHYRHLEIGPGHGLLLYLAANDPRCSSVTGWDVSETSVNATLAMMKRLGVTRPARVVNQNLFDGVAGEAEFDSIVISEVCEHLEDPHAALARLRGYLSPGGRIFVNVPINSPAPDHIYLLNSPEEGVDLVKKSGFDVVDVTLFPMTGFDEKRARKMRATISCCVTATV